MNESSIFKDAEEEEETPLSNVDTRNVISLPTSVLQSISQRCVHADVEAYGGTSGRSPRTNLLGVLSAPGLVDKQKPARGRGHEGSGGSHEMQPNSEGEATHPSITNSMRKQSPLEKLSIRAEQSTSDLIYMSGSLEASVLVKQTPFGVASTGGSDSDTDNSNASGLHTPAGDHNPTQSSIKWNSVSSRITCQSTEDSVGSESNQRLVDEFGFLLDEEAQAMDQLYRKKNDNSKVLGLEDKWANMTADWDYTYNKMRNKLKERCRKGIPAKLRGISWQLLIGSHAIMKSPDNAGVYIMLCNKTLKDKEVDLVIERDLARTFPNNVLFQEEGGAGQVFLRNVLHAYAACDPEVGYTQGMAFLVGALATQMDEERSFWALHEMMYHERYKMRELFRPGFPMLKQFFYQLKKLLAHLLPKLHERFEKLGVDPSFYASQWFLTLFVYHFPFHALLRIWDVFFSEGWKIVFRTSIALMKWEEKRLLALPFEELLPALKSLQNNKNCSELLDRAHRVKFKTSELNKYANEYWEIVARGHRV
ncbi:unnamed protein product [Phytomonas sp. EM1]|nr:unnamed protein product [Phytomonas sp. EM1]|eukprot:CCW63266.1 unnamed protein product [Phytomonas sp. isolate EM1]